MYLLSSGIAVSVSDSESEELLEDPLFFTTNKCGPGAGEGDSSRRGGGVGERDRGGDTGGEGSFWTGDSDRDDGGDGDRLRGDGGDGERSNGDTDLLPPEGVTGRSRLASLAWSDVAVCVSSTVGVTPGWTRGDSTFTECDDAEDGGLSVDSVTSVLVSTETEGATLSFFRLRRESDDELLDDELLELLRLLELSFRDCLCVG